MFDFFESNADVFHQVWLGAFVVTLIVFFVGGRKAEEKFQGLEQQSVRFREKGASGRSHRSWVTRSGGARRVLDVIVTDRELWIKGIWPAFTYIGTRFDLSHRVPLERVVEASVDRSRVFVTIRDELGIDSKLELELKKPGDFVQALNSTQ